MIRKEEKSMDDQLLQGGVVDDQQHGEKVSQGDGGYNDQTLLLEGEKDEGSLPEEETSTISTEFDGEDQQWDADHKSKDDLRLNIKDPDQLSLPSTLKEDQDHPAEKDPWATPVPEVIPA